MMKAIKGAAAVAICAGALASVAYADSMSGMSGMGGMSGMAGNGDWVCTGWAK